MSDEPSLLAAVRAFPANDVPRLAYADWLDEHAQQVPCSNPNCRAGWERAPTCFTCRGTGTVSDGRAERAEFIRVQCEIACLRDEMCRGNFSVARELAGAVQREERLLLESAIHPDRPKFADDIDYYVASHVGAPPPRGGLRGRFSRGFIGTVCGDMNEWLSRGDDILAAHPVAHLELVCHELPRWVISPRTRGVILEGDPKQVEISEAAVVTKLAKVAQRHGTIAARNQVVYHVALLELRYRVSAALNHVAIA